MKVPLRAAYASLTILVCGCGGHTLNAGSNTDAGAVAPPTGVRWSGWPPSNDLNETCMAEGSTSVAGSWVGHFDDYVFPSGSNEIRIDLIDVTPDAEPPNSPCGKIAFGTGDPPPLPTDPTAYYPPGSPPVSHPQLTVYEGFRYDFAGYELDSSVNAQHFELGIMTGQIYKAWCEMQPSFYRGVGANPIYDCVPSNGGTRWSPDGGCEIYSVNSSSSAFKEGSPIGCAELALCAACSCAPNGCGLPAVTADVHLDIQLQGDAGSGNASFPLDGIHAFQLKRAP